MRRSQSDVENIIKQAEETLRKIYIGKGRNFTFTTPHLAKWMNISPSSLCRFMQFLESDGVIVRTGWKSRKRLGYRTQFKESA